MKIRTGNYLVEVGQRLAIVRNEARLTRSDMARKLGIHPNNYYKHEVGAALEQDHVLLHEVMLYFYKYKQDRQAKETIPLT